MIRLRSEKFGQSYRGKAGHRRPAEKAQVANISENAPSNVEAWRRTYTRAYMRRWRARSMAVGATEPEKQPQVEENPVPPVKQRKPPPKGERKARWAARAEEMKTLAESMLMDEPARHDEATGSGLRAHVGARGMTASGYWMNQTGGALRPEVKVYLGGGLRPAIVAYLDGGKMTSTELMALHAYLKRSITTPNLRGGGVESLCERVEDLDTREKLREWLSDARELGIDPL